MALSQTQVTQAAAAFRLAADETMRRPLWEFHPYYALMILSERQRRGLLQHDPEPIGDPEYS